MFRQTDEPKFTVFLLLGSSCTSFDGFRMVDVATQYALTGSNSAPLFRANSAWPVEARIKRIGWTVTRNQGNQVLVHQPFMIVWASAPIYIKRCPANLPAQSQGFAWSMKSVLATPCYAMVLVTQDRSWNDTSLKQSSVPSQVLSKCACESPAGQNCACCHGKLRPAPNISDLKSSRKPLQTLWIKPRAWKRKHWTLLIEVSRIQKPYMIIYVLLILSQFQLLSWKSAISMCLARHDLVTYCCVRDSLYTEQGASRGIGYAYCPCSKRRADQVTKSIPWTDGMAPCKGSWHYPLVI